MPQEYISIPVPVDRVQEVYQVLARTQGSPAAAPSPGDPVEAAVVFDPALIATAYRESAGNMRKVFDYLAKNSHHDVPMADLAAAVGLQPRRMAGAFGAFGRRWQNRYHKGVRTKWPFHAWWDGNRNSMVYKMSAECAEVIKGL